MAKSTRLHELHPDRYKWVALSNTTLGILMATINGSIILISLPAIFNGIGINPLVPSNTGYLLWMMMGYMLVTAVLVVSLGRLGDIMGRVRIYNFGFAVFTIGSVLLALDPFNGGAGAMWLVVLRLLQGVGGAMLFANSSAIIVDAFPAKQRGLAMGINQVAAIAGSFIGLVAGGLLSVVHWRWVFWVSVPFGILGTFWAYHSLRDNGKRIQARIDWIGNITFAIGLTSLLTAIVYAIQPYGTSAMGWTNPSVDAALIVGLAFLALFIRIELRVDSPMFDLRLFKNRAFSMGSFAGLLSATARGGLQFMLIIWLQGIWLPQHGYSYDATPLWAGIYLLPMTIGFLIAGPAAGFLSDKHGARILSTIGMVVYALSFVGLLLIPTNFNYTAFAALIAINGMSGGLFAAPNSTAIMNSVPAANRGGAAGIQAAFLNSGSVLSMGLFFSLMIVGLAGALPSALVTGLTAHGVSAAEAHALSQLPPVAILFSSLLGFNPLATLLGSASAAHVTSAQWAVLTGRQFFPQMITEPFHNGLVVVFGMAIVMSLVAAVFSALRGARYVHEEVHAPAQHVHEHLVDLAASSGAVPGEPALENELL